MIAEIFLEQGRSVALRNTASRLWIRPTVFAAMKAIYMVNNSITLFQLMRLPEKKRGSGKNNGLDGQVGVRADSTA